jgi:two-component system, OmpR family, response regulator
VIRLLIADDETSILFAMKEYFEALGYAVDCAADEERALALLGAGEYDLVIADLRLCAARPQGGLAVAAAVKARWPRTRTMILTAYGSPEAREQARGAGVDAFLHKQDRLQHVAAVVRGLTAARD